MDHADDFVVVDEESALAQKMLVERLKILVDLFSKALDSVNQSNTLLKDELCSALSVTLQHIAPDPYTPTEDLVKILEGNVTGTDVTRSNYTRRLCSRLVAVNEEKQALLAEMHDLKQSIARDEIETQEKVASASTIIKNITTLLSYFEDQNYSQSSVSSTNNVTTLTDLFASLTDIQERLSQLQLAPKGHETQAVLQTKTSECTSQTTPTSTLYRTETQHVKKSEVEIQTLVDHCHASTQVTESLSDSQSTSISKPIIDQLGENDWNVCTTNVTTCGQDLTHRPSLFDFEVTSENTVGTQQQPSFSAQEEDPWCPCCGQRLESRDQLECHLLECLQ